MDNEIRELARTISEYRNVPGVETYVDQLVSEIRDLKPMRYAVVTADVGKGDQIAAYMPGNYEVIGRTPIGGSNQVKFLIGGRDSCGWTLDGYVIPRLQSGMYYAEEVA